MDTWSTTSSTALIAKALAVSRYCWILAGQHPAFIKYQGQFEQGGLTWRIELASPLHEGELQQAGKK